MRNEDVSFTHTKHVREEKYIIIVLEVIFMYLVVYNSKYRKLGIKPLEFETSSLRDSTVYGLDICLCGVHI